MFSTPPLEYEAGVFEELDYQPTANGEISLRRRSEPKLDNLIVYEVKLGDEFLMSSLFVEAEEQLSILGLQQLANNGHLNDLDIVVGGLGLGYTALKAIQNTEVTKLRVIDIMAPVISWHQQGLLPIGDVLATDPRCELIESDFFAVATAGKAGFFDESPVDAILLDIDHSPSHFLEQGNQGFYTQQSLQSMASKLKPGGVFGLWSNELPDVEFEKLLKSVFKQVNSHIIRFANPYSGGESYNSVYIAY